MCCHLCLSCKDNGHERQKHLNSNLGCHLLVERSQTIYVKSLGLISLICKMGVIILVSHSCENQQIIHGNFPKPCPAYGRCSMQVVFLPLHLPFPPSSGELPQKTPLSACLMLTSTIFLVSPSNEIQIHNSLTIFLIYKMRIIMIHAW